MKTLVRDEKGQFVAPAKISEVHILHDVWKVSITRDGQEAPHNGNRVKVKMTIECIGDFLKFKNNVFGLDMYPYANYWYQGKVKEKLFYADKWVNAFEEAKQMAYSELAKYDALVNERKQALINAEL